MSVAMMFLWPSCRASDSEPMMPPTGPDPREVSGISTALVGRQHPARHLHDEQRLPETGLVQRVGGPAEVGGRGGGDVAVDDRGHGPLVLAHAGRHLVRAGHVDVGRHRSD